LLINVNTKKIIKLKKLSIYSKFYKLSIFAKIYLSLKYYIPKNVKLLDEVFKHHNGLKFLPKKLLKSLYNKSCITAGASWGDSSLVFSQYCKTIYAFEPSGEFYTILLDVIDKNKMIHKIIPQPQALFHSCIEAFLRNDIQYNIGHYLEFSQNPYNQPITTITTDSFIKEKSIDNLGLIHLDIEGFEYNAIIGNLDVIKKYKPILLISIYHNERDFFKIKPLIESLNLGYKFKIRKLSRSRFELMLICYVD
jgi:FkbM family methyltransferase